MNNHPSEWMTGTERTGTPAGDTMKEIAQHHEHVLNLARRMYEQGWNDAQYTFDNPLQLTLVQDQFKRKISTPVVTTDAVMKLLMKSGEEGLNCHELGAALDVDYKGCNPILTRLHKTGVLCRLNELRNGAKVYVLPLFVEGRQLAPFKENQN